MSKRTECVTPGCCTCPGMSRCPGCGYTAHDKAHLMDHRFCRNAKRKAVLPGGGTNG